MCFMTFNDFWHISEMVTTASPTNVATASRRCCSSRFKPLSFVSKRDEITNVMVLYATHAANGGTPSLQPLHVSRSARCRFATMYRPTDGTVARPARYDRGCILLQAARRSGRLPAVKHDSALRAVSLRDGITSVKVHSLCLCGGIQLAGYLL